MTQTSALSMKTDILRFLTDELLNMGPDQLSSADDLLSTELLDSMGVMRLLAYLEEHHEIRVPPEDVTVENFLSVDAICAYLERAQVEDTGG